MDPIEFWSERMQEHCLFLLIGLTNGAQRMDVLQKYEDEPSVQKMIYKAKTVNILKEEANNTIDLWNEYQFYPTDEKLSEAMHKTRKLKEEVYDILADGVWIGFNFLALVDHMIKELVFFQSHIDDSLTPEDEIKFWKKHNTEDCSLFAHLMDPSEVGFTDAFLDTHSEGKKLKARILEVIDYTQKVIDTSEEMETERASNIIYPILALHERKEQDYCLKRLNQLLEFD